MADLNGEDNNTIFIGNLAIILWSAGITSLIQPPLAVQTLGQGFDDGGAHPL